MVSVLIKQFRSQWSLLLAALVLLTTSLSYLNAQQPTSVAHNQSAANAKTYAPGDVHLTNSRVYVFVDKSGFGHIHGVAGLLKEGHLELDKTVDAGRLVFDMSSFAADASYARKYLGIEGETDDGTRRKVTANMLGPDVLNASQFPTATYQIRSIQRTNHAGTHGAHVYQFQGDLTLHGTTRPISFRAEVEPKGKWNRVHGRFTFKQSDFGIKPFSKMLGALGVADELAITGDLWVAATALQQ